MKHYGILLLPHFTVTIGLFMSEDQTVYILQKVSCTASNSAEFEPKIDFNQTKGKKFLFPYVYISRIYHILKFYTFLCIFYFIIIISYEFWSGTDITLRSQPEDQSLFNYIS